MTHLLEGQVSAVWRFISKHYGFSDEELDFIPSTKLRAGINYDIKYRMGCDAENGKE